MLPIQAVNLLQHMCPISPNFLYAGVLILAVAFSCYLGFRDVENPYEDRRVWRDAKAGGVIAKACIVISLAFGVLLVAFLVCLPLTK